MKLKTACLMLFLAASTSVAPAQNRTSPRVNRVGESKVRTIVSVELLADNQASGLTAQQWGRVFDKLGYAIRIRQVLLDEKPEVTERILGKTREVKVIGELDRRGRLSFPGRTFTQSDTDKLAEWLRSLEVYGAQGSPEGKPVWGLDKAQFDILFNALSALLTDDVEGKPLEEALAAMRLPEKYPVRFTTAARARLNEVESNGRQVRNALQGHSKGTALALALSEYGLGFRPQRTPGGGIELAIESKADVTDVWPIGWDLKQTRALTAPQMFKLVPVELQKVKLVDALAGISALTEVPIHVDHFGIEAHGIDVDEIVVSYPAKKTSWSLLLRGITVPYKLTRQFRIDEKGRPFVWITALVPGRTDD